MSVSPGRGMDPARTPETEVAAANAQLARFARDLKVLLERERRKAAEIEEAHLDTLLRLTRAAECKDAETGRHLDRLSEYARRLAIRFGLPEAEAWRIGTAAPLHDLGKIGVPDAVLMKVGPLDAAEWKIMRNHSAIGASLLKGSRSPLIETARRIALTHHECWDGSGYPQGLRGAETPVEGRIVMLADRYDALRSRRRYKEPLDHRTVCRFLLEGGERTHPRQLDPRLLELFREIHEELAEIFERHRD